MKFIFAFMFAFTATTAFAQAPSVYFSLYDRKVYTLKNKGVRDFVVDMSSAKLLDQVNDQKIFGRVKELTFRIHWTQSPERLAVDVIGLPEGFFEAKNALRASAMPLLDNLLPMTVEQRFPNYKIAPGKMAREFTASDSTGLAPIPSYVLKFDDQDRLSEVIGKKPLGSWNMNWLYEKKAFSEGKWVVSQVVVTNNEGGQILKSTRKLNYGTASGIGVLTEVVLTVEQQGENPVRTEESIEFKNYKINTGEGMRYFLGDAPATAPKSTP
ncbi:MAG: hypothetical protein V4598_15465 [Bdellovibrionota bacterium]